MTDPFRPWAEKYDAELGPLPPGHRPLAQRAQLLLSSRGRRRASWFGGWRLGALSTALALGVLALVVLLPASGRSRNEELPILLGDLPVRAGATIQAKDGNKQLHFPQGSRVTWAKGASGSLAKVTESAIELKLSEGTLDLDVEKKAGRRWVVTAGDFRVYVIGTAFTVSRDARTEEFRVQVSRGKVRVQGPQLNGGELLLGRGDAFRWRPETAGTAAMRHPAPPSQAEAQAPKMVGGPTVEPAPASRQPTPAKPLEDWQTLARAGKYELAVEMVQSQGTSRVLSTASAEDRVLLGNAARYSGRIDLSSRAYRAAREVPGASATLAAYYLAKAALDSNGDQDQAIKWLRTYLREAPTGDLSASARARLMSLLSASGRTSEAQVVAQDYLKMHPSGPQKKVAQRLLQRP